MPDDRRDALIVTVALTEFSVHYEQADPEFANRAWQLAADRLVDYDIEPAAIATELEL